MEWLNRSHRARSRSLEALTTEMSKASRNPLDRFACCEACSRDAQQVFVTLSARTAAAAELLIRRSFCGLHHHLTSTRCTYTGSELLKTCSRALEALKKLNGATGCSTCQLPRMIGVASSHGIKVGRDTRYDDRATEEFDTPEQGTMHGTDGAVLSQ
jgi:hypothetical protein